LKCFFRALSNPYHLPFFTIKGKIITVEIVDFIKTRVKSHLGKVVNNDSDGLYITCLDGYLIIKRAKHYPDNINYDLNSIKIWVFVNDLNRKICN